MTTEHVSVPRGELEEIARELTKRERNSVSPCARHFGEELEFILSRATPSHKGEVVVTKNEQGQIVAVTRQDEDGQILSVIAESTPSAPHVLTEPLSVFSGGMWTWNETGQSFTKAEMDEAAFIVYRDHAESFATSLPAARVSDEIRQEARRLLEYYTDSSLAPYVEDLPHSGVEKFLERLAK